MPSSTKLSTIILAFFLSITLSAQNDIPKTDEFKKITIGVEMQVYPTGVIPGIRLERFLNSHSSLNLRIGYQLINHRDFGIHSNETGNGYGISLGYRKFLKNSQKKFSLSLRSDLWFNAINWKDESPVSKTGKTDIIVLQPTLMAEYTLQLNNSMSITPSFSFGWEWNIITEGEPTGQGAIVLLGCSLSWRI